MKRKCYSIILSTSIELLDLEPAVGFRISTSLGNNLKGRVHWECLSLQSHNLAYVLGLCILFLMRAVTCIHMLFMQHKQYQSHYIYFIHMEIFCNFLLIKL